LAQPSTTFRDANGRILLGGECIPLRAGDHLSAPDNYNLQMDSLESVIEMKPTGPLPA
jgi:hypothetical protein